MTKVSIVIPAINEEEGIGRTLDEIPVKAFEAAGYDLEVIVVDGESVDHTRDIAAETGARVIIEPRKGYGRAYKTGFDRATGDIIVTADADLTYPIADAVDYVKLLEDQRLDFISCNRFGELKEGAMSAKHRFGNWVLSTTARVFFFVRVADSQSGMWVFRRSLLPKLRLTSDGMPFSEEIKIEAFRAGGAKAKEIPISYRQRVGEVKLSSWKDGMKNLGFLFKKRLGIAEPES
ncbi:MAG: glycosyltransferase family 2 protein [Thermoplasmatota archaeon]